MVFLCIFQLPLCMIVYTQYAYGGYLYTDGLCFPIVLLFNVIYRRELYMVVGANWNGTKKTDFIVLCPVSY